MAIHEREEIRLAVLQHVADEKEYSRKDILVAMANHFSQPYILSTAPSEAKVFRRKCISAIKHLKDRNLLEQPKPRHYKTTPNGLEFLRQNPAPPAEPDPVDDRVSPPTGEPETIDDANCPTPEECIEKCYQQHRAELAAELLEKIKNNSHRFFERLVLDLLIKMGYGGSREDAAEAVGRSHDGGIDGIINEDRLGLDVVYVQAKRWEGNVGRPEIHKFTGALIEKNARKGIFITTSDFSREARESADNSDDPKTVLIDGRQLAEFMIDHNVGVSTVKTYEIKRVDSDYFIETDDSQTQDS